MMDKTMRLIFREEFHLDDMTPGVVRNRIGSFAPLLGDATSRVQLAASEVTTAFARQREPNTSIQLRLLGIDRFRVEISDTLSAETLASSKKRSERSFRIQILDDTTDSWGVLGNGAAIVWFEIANVADAPLEDIS